MSLPAASSSSRLALCVFFGLCLSAARARGEAVIDVLPGTQVFPDIAGHVTTFDPCPDIYAIVWEDRRADGGDIFIRAITTAGAALGFPLVVDDPPGRQATPAIAKDSIDCLYLVVWDDKASGEIRGRFIDTGGFFIGGAFDIGPVDPAGGRPDVAWNPLANRFLVVWHATLGGDGSDIVGRYVDPPPIGPVGPVWLFHNGPEEERRAVVAANIYADRFMIAWDEGTKAPPRDRPNAVFARVMGTDELAPAVGAAFPVACVDDPPNITGAPDIAFDGNAGKFLITFTDNRERAGGSRLDIRGQFVSADGDLLDNPDTGAVEDDCEEHFVIADGPPAQRLARVSFDPTENHFLVVWEGKLPGDTYRVRRRMVDAFEGDLTPIVDVSGFFAEDARQVAVANDISAGSWFAVWSDDRGDTRDLFGAVVP